jgi:hypothetical protein
MKKWFNKIIANCLVKDGNVEKRKVNGILRGGKKIGGIDVRIGIPRDRSLDNVTGDPRLKRTQGGNPESYNRTFSIICKRGRRFC